MPEIKSPYNFVPAPSADEIYTPEWAHQVSHDIPFSDGESGEIELTITAETPIFIRNGHARDVEDNTFSHYIGVDGKPVYFIPATSLKGMFRNVLEIMSNSDLGQINDHHHAVRQIVINKNDVINEGYELSKDDVKKSIQCGYLKKENNEYYIYPCGKPLKIRYTDIDAKMYLNFEEKFGKKDSAGIRNKFDNRSAKYKYELLANDDILQAKFIIHPLDEDDKQKSWVSQFQPLSYVKLAQEFEETEVFDGQIVFVGQASNYDVKTSRRGDYVFKGLKTEVLKNTTERYIVSEEVFKTFKFVNRDGQGKAHELADWAFWKSKIAEGIPVFFRKDDSIKETKNVLDFGLSFMYKQPTKHKVKELNHSKNGDLADVIFGQSNKEDSLKGRVFIGHAFTNNGKCMSPVTATLGSPKSSYTPFYLKQEGKNGKTKRFNTYNTDKSELAGFKRYPAQSTTWNHEGEAASMQTIFKPLEAETEFIGKIRFHNLRPIEIGALLSCVTLHNTENTFHNLGYAKPLGYGRVKLNITENSLTNNIEHYLKIFELEMRARYGQKWEDRINELITMSSLHSEHEHRLRYNDLKEFQLIKNEGGYLQSYGELVGRNDYNSLSSENDIQGRINEINAEIIKKANQIQELKNKIAQNIDDKDYEYIIALYEQLSTLDKIDRTNEIITLNQKENEENIERAFLKSVQELLISTNLEEINSFVKDNEFDERIEPLKQKLAGLKANSGMPERLKNRPDFKQFKKEAEGWIKKVDNKVFSDSVVDFKNGLIYTIRKELEDNRTSKNWTSFENENWNWLIEKLGQSEAQVLYNDLVKPK